MSQISYNQGNLLNQSYKCNNVSSTKATVEERSTIKNLSEFGIDLTRCKSLYSADLNFGIHYDADSFVTLDLNKKTILTKYYCDNDSTILRIKITNKNYLLVHTKLRDCEMIRVSKIGSLCDEFEVKLKDDILDFIYSEQIFQDSVVEFMFLLTKQGEMITHNFLTNRKTTVNVVKDSEISKKAYNLQLYFHFIEIKAVILIFFSNGIVISYSLDHNPENLDDPYDYRTYFDEVRSLKCFQRAGANESNLLIF